MLATTKVERCRAYSVLRAVLHVLRDRLTVDEVVRAVLKLLSSHVTAGEIRQVRDQLPAEVRSLWEMPA